MDFPSRRKNDPTTTMSPESGPTEMSIPAVITTMSWPKLMKASAAKSVISDVMLNAAVNRAFWLYV